MSKHRSMKSDFIIYLIIASSVMIYLIFGDRASFVTKGKLKREAEKIPYTTEEVYNQETGRKEIKEKFKSKEDEKRFNELNEKYGLAILNYWWRALIILICITVFWLFYFVIPAMYYVIVRGILKKY